MSLNKKWTETEIDWLKNNYPKYGKIYSAKQLNRSLTSIRTKSSELKLKSSLRNGAEANSKKGYFKGKKRPEHSQHMKRIGFVPANYFTEETRKQISLSIQKAFQEGRLKANNFEGHRHSDISKKKMSEASKKMWANPNHKLNSEQEKQRRSDTSSKYQQANQCLNRYSRGNGQHYNIAGNKFWFRSSWEVVYAKYLQFLKERKKILDWQYEVDTFWFEAIKRGVRSYKPDFKVFDSSGNFEYHEVKGYMDSKSKTKIKRMAKYYPNIKLIIIGKEEFKEIKKWERMFPDSN